MPDESLLIPGRDYYINDDGLWVFTATYLQARGYCCETGCLHCPYGFRKGDVGENKDHSTKAITTRDQMGNELTFPFPPQRIISIVPSQTELLFDLGLEKEIVGITKFCIHPGEKIKTKEKIGGTKKFNLEKIHALKPDLIIGNKEENYPEGIYELQQHYPVWMSDVVTLSDACWMISEMARITDREKKGMELVEEFMKRFNSYQQATKKMRGAYFIWHKPYMVAASGTFINEMLKIFGIENVFSQLDRYPEVSFEMIVEAKPEIILLSSEPYPFTKKHFEEFKSILPESKLIIVNGEYFSWYGSRLLQVPAYFEMLKRELAGTRN